MHGLQKIFLLAQLLILANVSHAQLFSRMDESPVTNDGGSSANVSFVDIDNDGDLDLFITNDESAQSQFLYRNDGTGNFTRVTADPITTAGGHAVGASWGDYDNDGDSDCLIAHWGNANEKFYVNRGDGTFIDSTLGPLTTSHGSSETASWADYDQDGWLDVVVSNSAGVNHRTFLFHSNGDGTFTRVQTGVVATDGGSSRSVDWCDVDNDGDLDLFVVHENAEDDALFLNHGDDGFVTAPADQPPMTDAEDGVTSSWGDFDNDGDFDLFVGAINDNASYLYRNLGGTFEQVASSPLTTDNRWVFGSAWADYDNDGDIDLLATNGWGPNNNTFQHNRLYANSGSGNFTLAAIEPVTIDSGWSFGCAFGDIDRDQDLDLCIARWRNSNEDNLLYRNNGNDNHAITIRCAGILSNRSGIGTRLQCVAQIDGNRVSQIREVSGQNGYCGQNLEMHFGTGTTSVIDSLIVTWPSGIRDVYTGIQSDQHFVATEGQGIVSVDDPRTATPKAYTLISAYPNPFNPSTTIKCELSERAMTTIKVHDILGQEQSTLFSAISGPGNLNINYQPKNLAAGLYIVHVQNGLNHTSQKLLFLK